jgi:hypothetical protein
MYPNGSCKPILDTYIPRAFQKFKELFNPMSFVRAKVFSIDIGS